MSQQQELAHPDPIATVTKIAETAARVEGLADEISSLKAQLVELDRKRQGAVEALAQFRAARREPKATRRIGNNVWVCGGPLFIQLDSAAAERLCERERDDCTRKINECRSRMKRLSSELLALSPDQHMDPVSLRLLLSEPETSKQSNSEGNDDK